MLKKLEPVNVSTDVDGARVWRTVIGWTDSVLVVVESEVSWTVGGVMDVVIDIDTVAGSSVTASVCTEDKKKKHYSLLRPNSNVSLMANG